MSNHVRSWMQVNISIIGSLPLKDVCLPASHDAGMWYKSNGTMIGGTENNILTQTQSIYQQLQYGARVFDIRPTISHGKWVCGHYTDTGKWPLGWQGGDGASIDEVIDNVNRFTDENKELVIIDISHTKNMEEERDCNDAERADLLNKLSRFNHLYRTNNSKDFRLDNAPVNDYIGGNKSCVIVTLPHDEGFDLNNLAPRGFYIKNTQLPLKDRSMTHSQTDDEAIKSTLGGPEFGSPFSVINLSKPYIAGQLPLVLQSMVNDFPNTIVIDNVHNVDVITLSLAVTYHRHNISKGDTAPVIVYGGKLITSPEICSRVAAAIQKHEDYAVTNESMGGDPLDGVPKSCAVYYSDGGLVKGRFAREQQALPFSYDIRRIVYGGVEITQQAVYNRFFNAFAKRESIQITNDSLGGDPTPNIFKTCTIEYSGKQRTMKEGEWMDFGRD